VGSVNQPTHKQSLEHASVAPEPTGGRQMAELSFKVPEMTDGNAAKAITREVRKLADIAEVQIDSHTGWVLITGHRIDSDAIRRAISNVGYDAQL
jgi:copper chaperone CopZ